MTFIRNIDDTVRENGRVPEIAREFAFGSLWKLLEVGVHQKFASCSVHCTSQICSCYYQLICSRFKHVLLVVISKLFSPVIYSCPNQAQAQSNSPQPTSTINKPIYFFYYCSRSQLSRFHHSFPIHGIITFYPPPSTLKGNNTGLNFCWCMSILCTSYIGKHKYKPVHTTFCGLTCM